MQKFSRKQNITIGHYDHFFPNQIFFPKMYKACFEQKSCTRLAFGATQTIPFLFIFVYLTLYSLEPAVRVL